MYKYRNYPCNITSDDLLWCISGINGLTGASGVLEWCYSQEDAEQLLTVMQASAELFNLTAMPYSEFCAG